MERIIRIPHVIFGNNSSEKIGEEVKKLSGNKVLIITTEGIERRESLEKIKESLRNHEIGFGIFTEVEPEPSVRTAKKCISLAKGYDFLIGIGGGSVLDVTKAVSVGVTNNLDECLGINKVKNLPLKKILIPTTAGSGSEVSNVSVLNDDKGQKAVIYSLHVFADLAVVDPLLTLTMPQRVTAGTGMDALGHAIAAYTSLNGNIVSDTFALKSIELISKSLRRAYNSPQDLEARSNMSMAALLAGIAMSNSGVIMEGCPIAGATAEHAIALPLGSKYKISHGEAVALSLQAVLPFNSTKSQEKFNRVANVFGEESVVNAVRKLVKDLKLPQKLHEVGVKNDEIKELAENSMKATRLLVNNPREIKLEDMIEMLRSCY